MDRFPESRSDRIMDRCLLLVVGADRRIYSGASIEWILQLLIFGVLTVPQRSSS